MKLIGKLFKGIGALVVGLVVLSFVFGGSGKSSSSSSSSSSSQKAEQAASTETSEEASSSSKASSKKKDDSSKQEEAEEPAAEEEAADEGPQLATNSKYSVTIDGWSFVDNYDGTPCIALDYTFTNVSDDSATSMQLATNITVYQNGVECEDAWFSDGNSDDGYTNKVKAGVSVKCTRAYKLQDTTSDVEVEVAPLFSWNDDLLAYELIHIA
jgi:hypothetical protein